MSDNAEYTWVSDASARIKFELPTSWTRTAPASGLPGIVAKSPEGAVAIDFVFISHGEPEVVSQEKRIMAELDKIITDVVVTAPASNAVLNGLRVFGISGTGKSKGVAINWFSLAYGDGLGHGMLVTMLIESARYAEVKPATDRIARSISEYDAPA